MTTTDATIPGPARRRARRPGDRVMTTILNYGGGRQTVALCVLIARGKWPRPDRIVMADTGREAPSTFAYLDEYVRPLLAPLGLDVEVAPHSLARADLYGRNGYPLVPAFVSTGKLSAWCSSEWKREVVSRYLAGKGVRRTERWIGFSLDERRRVARILASDRDGHRTRFPLVERMLTARDCVAIVEAHGLPAPPRSSCWMCPNRTNAEWRAIRDRYPDKWAEACDLDEELRAGEIDRGSGPVWLHHSRVPLAEADLDTPEEPEPARQCGLGLCFV